MEDKLRLILEAFERAVRFNNTAEIGFTVPYDVALVKIRRLFEETQNLKRNHGTEESPLTAGDVAKEYGGPVGEIGCPHCGTTSSGHIGRVCSWCDMDMFSAYPHSVYERITENAKNKPQEWRYGQAVYNYAHKLYPEETRQLNGTDVDCFYRDDRVDDFLNNLVFLLQHTTIK